MTPAIIETCAKCGAKLTIEDHECNQCSGCYADLGQSKPAPHVHRDGCDAVIGGECRCGRSIDAPIHKPHCDRCGATGATDEVNQNGWALRLCAKCQNDSRPSPPKEPGVSLRIFRHCKEHGPDIYIESFIDRPGGESCPLCDALEEVKLLRGKLLAIAAAFNGWANGGNNLEAALQSIGRALGPPWPDKGENP
ncbi:MAG: hypothetical protein V1755_08650 [Chloroflexota bacterium]